MREQLLTLPLEKKVGQLFFVGVPGTDADAATLGLLAEVSPGGVCLFSRNIREARATRTLTDGIVSALAVPPFLSIDQEGGLVDRLRRVCEPMPAPNRLRSPDDARRLAELTAAILSLLGLNMNFAPVVDVITADRGAAPNGIYSRTFGSSAGEVSEFAASYLRALQEGGITGCLKHFPGLGATVVDSHAELPLVGLGAEAMQATDLAPYRALIGGGDVRAVMAAHAAFPNWDLQETDRDGKLLPSSLSFNFITKLLRQSLGYDGLVITDDLEMGAILKNYGIEDACLRAIAAGCDLLAVCNSPERIVAGYRAVLAAVQGGGIAVERIDRSLVRIAAAKARLAPPADYSAERLARLSGAVAELKKELG